MKLKPGTKVLHHPAKEEITRRFMEGQSINEVHRWLNSCYSKSPRYRLSAPTLQAFRKEVLKLEGQALRDLQEVKKEKDAALEIEYAAQAVQSTSAYKDKLNQIADKNLDVATKIIHLDSIISDRIENWFNILKSGEQIPPKADTELRKYIDQQVVVLQQYRKLVEGMADKRVDYNVNITVMNEQIQTIQGVIRDLICEELGAEKAIEFLGKLSDRLGQAQSAKELPAKVQDVTFKQLE
jgi:hypothetical protein